MDRIRNVIVSYWFQELEYNPKDKLDVLSKELVSIFKLPFIYNEEKAHHLISLPRIEALSEDKKTLFQMSLINANLVINVENLDNDEIILLLNNRAQLFFDTIKNIYDVKIFYTSIKIEMIEEKVSSANYLASKFSIDDSYEDFSIKRGFIKDDYYINYILTSGREYNFNIKRDENSLEQDLFDRTLISSLSKALLKKEFISKVIEINDRYAFNMNDDYESSLVSIRGIIIELKNILENKLYDKK